MPSCMPSWKGPYLPSTVRTAKLAMDALMGHEYHQRCRELWAHLATQQQTGDCAGSFCRTGSQCTGLQALQQRRMLPLCSPQDTCRQALKHYCCHQACTRQKRLQPSGIQNHRISVSRTWREYSLAHLNCLRAGIIMQEIMSFTTARTRSSAMSANALTVLCR